MQPLSRPKFQGFTLIELIVVLAIIAIVFTFATIVFSQRMNQHVAKDEAERLSASLSYIGQLAVFQGRPLRLQIEGQNYRVMYPKMIKGKVVWHSLEKYESVALARSHSVHVSATENQIGFNPSGELTPFRIQFSVPHHANYCVNGALSGEISVISC